jgi:tripartite motif-containing protein 71
MPRRCPPSVLLRCPRCPVYRAILVALAATALIGWPALVAGARSVSAARVSVNPQQGPDRPVTGTVQLAGGASIVGGGLGQTIEIHAGYTASSAHGSITMLRTRTSVVCPTPTEDLADEPWRAFTAAERFPYLVWSGGIWPFAVAVQFRDAQGNLSPVACDTVQVEGLVTPGPFPTAVPTPTPEVATELQFRVETPWRPPTEWYNASQVAAGPDGTVYVLDTQDHRVVAYGSDGTYRGQWGGLGRADGQLALPNGLAAGPDGQVIVTDYFSAAMGRESPDRLQRFNLAGRFLGTCPDAIRADAVGPDGTLYGAWAVAGGAEIRAFGRQCQHLNTWGGAGTEPGRFGGWVDPAVAPDGRVFVADGGNSRVQVFTPDGQFLSQWGLHGQEDGAFSGTLRLAIGPNGDVFVAESDGPRGRIQRFAASGRYLGRIGAITTDALDLPGDLTVGPDSSLYVLRLARQRIERYDSAGQLLQQWGHPADTVPLRGAVDVAFAPGGGMVVFEETQVQAFDRLGQWRWARDLPDLRAGTQSIRAGDVAPDGTVLALVGEGVDRLDAEGRPLASWPLAPLTDLQDLATGPDGAVFVADGAHHRVLRLDPAGRVVAEWGAAGFGNGELPDQIALDVGADGLVHVLDVSTQDRAADSAPTDRPAQARDQRVQVFDGFGHFRWSWAVQEVLGSGWSGEPRARRIAVGPGGVVYLTLLGTGSAGSDIGLLVGLTGMFGPRSDVGIGVSYFEPDDCPLDGFRPVSLDAGGDGRLVAVETTGSDLPRRLAVFAPQPAVPWRAIYYRDDTRTEWPVHATVPAVRFDWGAGAPAPDLPPDGFVARFEGRVTGMPAPVLGRYRLHVTADGGVRLWVDGRLAVDAWDAAQVDAGRTYNVLGDQALPVSLEYVDPGGPAQLRLDWSRELRVASQVYLPLVGPPMPVDP